MIINTSQVLVEDQVSRWRPVLALSRDLFPSESLTSDYDCGDEAKTLEKALDIFVQGQPLF